MTKMKPLALLLTLALGLFSLPGRGGAQGESGSGTAPWSTKQGCVCKEKYMVNSPGFPACGELQSGCPQSPCDGDDKEAAAGFPSWCFVEGDDCGLGANGSKYDYCKPPPTTTSSTLTGPSSTRTTSTSTETQLYQFTDQGCQCMDAWMVANVGKCDGVTFKGCGMDRDDPCDGDPRGTWCFVKEKDCGLKAGGGVFYDYCTPLPEGWVAPEARGAVPTPSITATTTTVTPEPTFTCDECVEAFKEMGGCDIVKQPRSVEAYFARAKPNAACFFNNWDCNVEQAHEQCGGRGAESGSGGLNVGAVLAPVVIIAVFIVVVVLKVYGVCSKEDKSSSPRH